MLGKMVLTVVVLFIMLYKVYLTFKSVCATPVCDHLNESCRAVVSCDSVYYTTQGGSKKVLYCCTFV